jgi:hypothetical protein
MFIRYGLYQYLTYLVRVFCASVDTIHVALYCILRLISNFHGSSDNILV